MIPEFTDLFAQSPDYQIAKADKSIYRSFCSKEPELVSCYDNFDGDYDEEFLVFKKNNQPLGLASIVIRENPNKPAQPKIYARLGLIIVDKKYREIGIGRLLIVCSLLFALRTQRQQIYSISCLAAYAMVEKCRYLCYLKCRIDIIG